MSALVDTVCRRLDDVLEDLEAAAAGDPGRAGLAYASLHELRTALGAVQREERGSRRRRETLALHGIEV